MATIIASIKDLPPGRMKGVEAGGKAILLANVGGQFYAIGNICTHMRCMLSTGMLTGKNVECPCHGSTFDVSTGRVVQGPAQLPEPSYKVRVEGDNILLD